MVETTQLNVRRRQRRPGAWLHVRRRHVGSWAFALNRLAGLGLVLYLILHLFVLSLLAKGPATWNDFVALAKSPLILPLDIILLAGILYHGLNGIRVALIGVGIGVRQHKALFWTLMLIAAVLLLLGTWGFITV